MPSLIVILALIAASADDPFVELKDYLRLTLEGVFRESTGLEFQSFDCAIPTHTKPGDEFDCRVVDEEGDRFGFLIQIDAEGEMAFSMYQPFSQLDPEGRKVLQSAPEAVLDAFQAGDWTTMHQGLSAALQAALPEPQLTAGLAPLRAELGEIQSVTPEVYANPGPGDHDIDYAIRGAGGAVLARFRVHWGDGAEPEIKALVMLPAPGTPLQRKLIEAAAGNAFGTVFGSPVAALEAPFELLYRKGSAVEGVVKLADDWVHPVRIEQASSIHSFESSRYEFQVLDIVFLVQRYLEQQGTPAKQIDCPTPTVPDGGQLTCTATLQDGQKQQVTMRRRGGAHRLAE